MLTLKKRASLWNGWNVESITNGKDAREEFAKKMITKVIEERIKWGKVRGVEQEEVECGPRTLCHILYIVQK